MKKFCIMLLIFFLPLASLLSEIALEEYRNMQASAPEQIEISVKRVSTKTPFFSGTTYVTVKADVVSVRYSETKLSVGDSITITYTHFKPRKHWVGPRAIPILKKHTTSDAFLFFDLESNTYVPAAKGASFDPLPIPR